jgi:hypothetical protein
MIDVTAHQQIQMTASDKAFGFILFGCHQDRVGRAGLIGKSQSTADARDASEHDAAKIQRYFQ